jgi:hypothetical protein
MFAIVGGLSQHHTRICRQMLFGIWAVRLDEILRSLASGQ